MSRAHHGAAGNRATPPGNLLAVVILGLGLLSAAPAGAEAALWTLQGRDNRVYLFGSVHMLGDEDFAFPGAPDSALAAAYEDAESLIMEVRPDEAASPALLAATATRAIDPQGRTLDELLGSRAAAVHAAAARRGIDLASLAAFEPWFASLVITVKDALGQGLAAEHGVERRVAAIAARDGKPVAGLETVDEQLQLFDQLAPAVQSQLLLKTIEESASDDPRLAALVAAWKRGDLEALEELMAEEFAAFPELRATLVENRNRRWAEQILRLLDDDRDYLVIVGALHLVGPDGVPALLRERGVRTTRH